MKITNEFLISRS